MICDPFSVVVVPFPFTDSINSKKRPALTISSKIYQEKNNVITLLMITTAEHNPWFGDYLIQDLTTTGLPLKSIIRQKIFTIDSRLIIKKIGSLSDKDQNKVCILLNNHLELHPNKV